MKPTRLRPPKNAAKAGLKIFTIGIGTTTGDLIRVTNANGNSDYVRDEQGNVVKSHLNEALLQQIASASRRVLSAVARRKHDGHALRTRPRAAAEVGRRRKAYPPLS